MRGRAVWLVPFFSFLEPYMVKNTVQRDEKRVIIYYTFNDEETTQPSALSPESGSEATHE